MMDTLLTVLIGLILASLTMIPYLIAHRKKEKKAREKLQKTANTELSIAPALHPKIDIMSCIGCGSCVKACPEGDVLGMIESKVNLIHAAKCVGHGLCADECPVGAIELVVGSPGRSANLPLLDEHYQTSVQGIYIAGELGGIGLIKNAIHQGIQAVEHIAAQPVPSNGAIDIAIVGAGPAGLAAALNAKRHGLQFLSFEQGDIGGTILQYPRRKIVMTAPAELPLYGKIKLTETTKENLLDVWNRIIEKTGLRINTNEKVLKISRKNSHFEIGTARGAYEAKKVVLALGRRGTPRKLGIPGEQLSKVMYRLIEAESYQDCKILVVGGGDSAIEAAVGLASQRGNHVTLSYRKAEFSRIKERNAKHLEEFVSRKKIHLMLNSNVNEISPESVKIEAEQEIREIPNDYVFIFAGGELPYDFLQKVGVQFHSEAV